MSSVEQASSFFEKVQLDFQPSNLLEQLILLDIPLLFGMAVREDLRQLPQRLLLPARNQIRVHAESLRDLRSRLVSFDRLNGDLRLQAGRA